MPWCWAVRKFHCSSVTAIRRCQRSIPLVPWPALPYGMRWENKKVRNRGDAKMMKRISRSYLILVMFVSALGWTQSNAPASGKEIAEQGTFHLHKFEQLIGKETYTITRSSDAVVLKSDFKFTD